MNEKHHQNVTRRRLVAGAGAAGALAAAVAALPMRRDQTARPAPADPAPAQGGGYRLSEHVLHYYQTARL